MCITTYQKTNNLIKKLLKLFLIFMKFVVFLNIVIPYDWNKFFDQYLHKPCETLDNYHITNEFFSR